jgi:hypothetical protein
MAKPDAGTPPWFRVLEAARSLSPREDRTFTAAQLAAEAGIEETPKSRPSQIAAAWLSKLVRWGYVNFAGKIDAGGIRQANAYAVTKLGRTCEVTEGCPGKLVRLITAVRVFEKSRRTGREEAAYQALLKTTADLEGR